MEKLQRITDFRKLGLGFFLHFGLYNQIGKGEWYGNMYHLSGKEYYSLFGDLSKFKLKLDIKNIIKTAKENNFKYITMTTKHHDGFALFNSNGISKYDITKTATNRDLIQEFITECHKNDIKPILYFCTLDWMWDEMGYSFEKQLELINKEIEILCKTYQGIKGFWFDGNWSRKEADWKVDKLYGIIRKYIPEAIIVNNSGLTNAGKENGADVLTFEQGHLKDIDYSLFNRDLGAEACQSFTDHWGIATEDYNYKSTGYLISKFIDARKQKANYLLNVSIDKNGKMLPIEIETIKVFGKWINKYGYMLFDDYQVIATNDKDFIIKTSNNKYYGFFYDLPSGGHVKVIQQGGKIQPQRKFKVHINHIKEMIFLDNKENIDFIQNNDTLTIIPTASNYGYNTIIRVLKIITT